MPHDSTGPSNLRIHSAYWSLGLPPAAFAARFNRAADLSVLNLYDGSDPAADLPDVMLADGTGTAVAGSIVWDASADTLRFVRTGGPLAPGTYTATLVSDHDAWKDTAGQLLDGDADDVPGGDFVTEFTVAPDSTRVVSLPDFARGAGQPVDVPSTAAGLPISIDDATGMQSLDFHLTYDPALLNVTAVTLSPALSGAAQGGVPWRP